MEVRYRDEMAHLPTPPPQTARYWVGRNVRRYREEQGLTIGQLAERVSELGFPLERTQLSKIENGRTNVDVEKLLALATALDVLPDRLLRDPDELDQAILDRLLNRWRDLMIESLVSETRFRALSFQLNALSERSPAMEKKVSEAMAEQDGISVRVTNAPINFSSPAYDDFLDEILIGQRFEVVKKTENLRKGKGGK
jgi:transcriptional regulator with XRE-family HTH domain